MRTAIRTVPYDSNKYPKVHDLPRRVKVWDGDRNCEELQYVKQTSELAGRLDDFYRHEIDKGRSYRQFVWGCPIEAIDSSNTVIVFHDIRRNSEGNIRTLHCKVVKREEFEKAYIIS